MTTVMENSAGSCRRPLDYNYKKVEKGVASVLMAKNIALPEDKDFVYLSLLSREKAPLRSSARNLVLNMSVNPGRDEIPEESEAKAFITELLERFGFADQPYVVFQHNDIHRQHYHIVASRIRKNDTIIKSGYDHYKMLGLLEELSGKYHYKVGKDKRDRKVYDTLRFDPEGDRISQIESLIEKTYDYSFDTFEQLRLIMLSHGVDIQKRGKTKSRFTFLPLDKKGRVCAAIDKGIRGGLQYGLAKRISEPTRKPGRKKEKGSLRETIISAAQTQGTLEGLAAALAATGISTMIIHKDSDEGGGPVPAFVDHPSGVACTAEDLGIKGFLEERYPEIRMPRPLGLPLADVWETILTKNKKEERKTALRR